MDEKKIREALEEWVKKKFKAKGLTIDPEQVHPLVDRISAIIDEEVKGAIHEKL